MQSSTTFDKVWNGALQATKHRQRPLVDVILRALGGMNGGQGNLSVKIDRRLQAVGMFLHLLDRLVRVSGDDLEEA